MSGLILKDLFVIRKSLKIYLFLCAFYLALTVIGVMSISFIAGFLPTVVMLLPTGAFSYDEHAHWNRYAMILPLRRGQVVRARYSFALAILVVAAGITLLACIAASILGNGSLEESIWMMLGSLGAGLLIENIMFPLNYKLGVERAKPWMYVVIVLAVLFISFSVEFDIWEKFHLDNLPTGLPILFFILMLAGFGVSYLISCRIVARKEF